MVISPIIFDFTDFGSQIQDDLSDYADVALGRLNQFSLFFETICTLFESV